MDKAGQETLNSQLSTLNSKDWWSLFRLLQRNHLVALTAETVAALDVPREVKIPWLAEADKAVRWYQYQHEVQDEIVEVMAKRGIETLVLKGTHIAQYYPTPELREFGDLDLYFYNKHDEADRVAREVLKVEVSNDAHHHSKYNYRGVTVESHYDFVNVHYPPSNRRYEALLKELVSNNSIKDSRTQSHKDSKSQGQLSTFNFQLSTFEILFLLRHMACHFASSRITLRDLADWALTCRALQDKVDWPLVERTVSDYGMTEFVSALNAIAEQRLGTQPPSHPVTQSPSHPDSMSRCLDVSKAGTRPRLRKPRDRRQECRRPGTPDLETAPLARPRLEAQDGLQRQPTKIDAGQPHFPRRKTPQHPAQTIISIKTKELKKEFVGFVRFVVT